jgi:hypothetical protein
MKTTKINPKIMMLAAAMALVALCPRPAKAGIVVGQCTAGTQYSTIQAAVNAAPSGATIQVCPGYYPEQVVIQSPLTLQGIIKNGAEGAFIGPPTGGFVSDPILSLAPQLTVKNTSGVTVSNLIVDPTGATICGSNAPVVGILFHNASGTVSKMTVRNQAPPAGQSCATYGMLASVDNQQPQTVTVTNNDFRNNGTEAIEMNGPGLTANTVNNFVAGTDASPTFSVGIDYEPGAVGTIQGNTVIDEFYSSNVFPNLLGASFGIIGLCTQGLTISGNMLSNNQVGIAVGCPPIQNFASNTTITGNHIVETRSYDGILILSNGNLITNNTIVAAGESGIHFDAELAGGSNNKASGNTITETCGGVLSSGAVKNNTLSANTYNDVYVPTEKAANCGPIFQ